MAYTINKAPHVQDEVTIQDGGKTLTVAVDIYVDDVLADIGRVRAEIAEAQARVQDLKRQEAGRDEVVAALQQLDRAAAELFTLIFGEDQTEELNRFYGGRTLSMLVDFLPYFTEVILPAVNDAQKRLADRYTAWRR